MESFSVSTNLNQEDWTAYKRAAVSSIRTSSFAWWHVGFFGVIAFGMCALVLFDLPISGPSFIFGIAIGVALIAMTHRLNKRAAVEKQRGAFLGVCSYEFSSAGLRVSRDGIQALIAWSEFRQLAAGPNHLFLWLRQQAAYVVPIRDLPPEMSREDAEARIRLWIGVTSATTNVASDPNTLTINEWLNQRNANSVKKYSLIATLLRLLVLVKTPGEAITGSDRSIVALIAVSTGLWVAINHMQVGGSAELHLDNLPAAAFIVVCILLLTLIFARRSNPTVEFRRVLVIVLAVLPLVVITNVLSDLFLHQRGQLLTLFVLIVYLMVYATTALGALSGTRQPNAGISGVVLGAALWWLATSFLYLDASVWFSPSDSNDAADDLRSAPLQTEDLLFSQRERIDKVIDAIQRPEKPAVNFFVGFAGVGEQRVFAEEIKLALKTVGERFGIDHRSLLLVNDRRDLDTNPLATTVGLRYALSQLAKKMNVEKDVLFLSLSSHGSSEPKLSVSNTALPLNDLSGEELSEALDDSDIKWRVIIISACHSGAFIKYLENPYTVIITASAADKTSFGCSDDRDLTYFGEAFYRDALPKSKSLAEAFNAAKAAIVIREKQEGVDPSDPQASFGAEISRKLEGT
jgi:hypothetical protein